MGTLWLVKQEDPKRVLLGGGPAKNSSQMNALNIGFRSV